MDFKGRTVCITGAGAGIGRALCEEVARRGAAKIIAVARNRRELPDRLGIAEVAFVGADLAEPGVAAALAGEVALQHRDCSVLINNAGSQLINDCVAPDSGDSGPLIEREVQLNLLTPILLGLHLAPTLLRHRRPVICNITSGLALAPKQSAPVYCATKAGLSSYTRALRYQAQATQPGLLVCEALPPLVDTQMTKGRGKGKMTAEACARRIIEGMEREEPVIDVGKTRLLRTLLRVSPGLAHRIMRNS